MRIVGVLVATTLLGLVLGVLLVEPNIAGAHGRALPRAAPADCEKSLCESAIWLRVPAMRRATFGR